MILEIIARLENEMGTTISLLSALDEKQLNTVPFEGSWTAAQVGRHLYKAEDGADQLLTTPAEDCNRPADAGVENLKNMLLDYGHKLNSPPFLLPEEKQYDKARLIEALHKSKEKVIAAAQKGRLTEVALLPDGHPLKGSSKLEIVHFMVYHTIRHNHQIQKISGIVTA